MRKLAIIIFSVTFTFAFGILTSGYGEPAKVDFTGEWQLDKARSEGLPPGTDQALTVTQKAERLEAKFRVLGGPDGERTVEDAYVVNGEAADFKPPLIGGGGKVNSAKRTSKWSAEGKGFDAVEQTEVEGDEGTGTINATRTWRLSDDGKTLTIEMSVTMPGGTVNKSKRVFTKK